VAIIAIHPGPHPAEELKELGMSAAELARQLDVPTNRITEILNGRRAITGDTALRLAHFFGTTAEIWLNLQSLYEVRLAEQKSGKSIKALPTGGTIINIFCDDLSRQVSIGQQWPVTLINGAMPAVDGSTPPSGKWATTSCSGSAPSTRWLIMSVGETSAKPAGTSPLRAHSRIPVRFRGSAKRKGTMAASTRLTS
jgi:antitoxin HigA-1